jgi:hypothetical protein
MLLGLIAAIPSCLVGCRAAVEDFATDGPLATPSPNDRAATITPQALGPEPSVAIVSVTNTPLAIALPLDQQGLGCFNHPEQRGVDYREMIERTREVEVG